MNHTLEINVPPPPAPLGRRTTSKVVELNALRSSDRTQNIIEPQGFAFSESLNKTQGVALFLGSSSHQKSGSLFGGQDPAPRTSPKERSGRSTCVTDKQRGTSCSPSPNRAVSFNTSNTRLDDSKDIAGREPQQKTALLGSRSSNCDVIPPIPSKQISWDVATVSSHSSNSSLSQRSGPRNSNAQWQRTDSICTSQFQEFGTPAQETCVCRCQDSTSGEELPADDDSQNSFYCDSQFPNDHEGDYIAEQAPRRDQDEYKTFQELTSQAPNKMQSTAADETYEMELAPGFYVPFRGANEVWDAIDSHTTLECTCLECSIQLVCVRDCEHVVCPDCRMVNPVFEHPAGVTNPFGAGMGLKKEWITSEQ
ncbi:expressed unknown protein [Seminavis robusta]|uniref:Uncharacterized protein n=1 Tax=Seminavis robusta TaxID=568900 RepID=A0A9N8HTD6_9STRA|nr:expressed unknown protein [Seminavis robusta]|eukprot:Sro1568_g283090.1 n/a (366) ;mRNA; r:18887-19984